MLEAQRRHLKELEEKVGGGFEPAMRGLCLCDVSGNLLSCLLLLPENGRLQPPPPPCPPQIRTSQTKWLL